MPVVVQTRVSRREGDGWVVANGWAVWCPGCEDVHAMGDHSFDGDLERPTFAPSILVQYGQVAGVTKRCHSFLTGGVWQFLGDSTHALAGQSIPAVPFPEDEPH